MLKITKNNYFEYTVVAYTDQYTAKLVMTGPSSETLVGTATEPRRWLFSAGASITSNYMSGVYNYTVEITSTADSEIVIGVEAGQIEVVENVVDQPLSSKSTHARKMIGLIEAVLENRVPKDVNEYKINNRELTKMTIQELLDLRNYYMSIVNYEGKSTIQKLIYRM